MFLHFISFLTVFGVQCVTGCDSIFVSSLGFSCICSLPIVYGEVQGPCHLNCISESINRTAAYLKPSSASLIFYLLDIKAIVL